ncbi:MAG TPA: hypothetical protein VFY29_10400 [Terriglobia bacterium]|nr:hypothetical protein [Terriglobia bacterium]
MIQALNTRVYEEENIRRRQTLLRFRRQSDETAPSKRPENRKDVWDADHHLGEGKDCGEKTVVARPSGGKVTAIIASNARLGAATAVRVIVQSVFGDELLDTRQVAGGGRRQEMFGGQITLATEPVPLALLLWSFKRANS